MSAITTHILDLALGRPGVGVSVVLERKTDSALWQAVAEDVTDADGRINNLISIDEAFLPGHYRLIFETGAYFLMRDIESFFPQITIGFVVKDTTQHYHVPLLLSPFGYSTYRGS